MVALAKACPGPGLSVTTLVRAAVGSEKTVYWGRRGAGVDQMVDEGQDGAILSGKVVFWDREVFGEPGGIMPAFVADLAEAMSFLSFGVALFVEPGPSGQVCGALVDVPAGIATEP